MRTVLFDLDGTLADSAPLITAHLAAAFAGHGLAVPDAATLRGLVGPPFETALPALGLTQAQTAAVIATYRQGYYAQAPHRTPVFPGVPAMLDRLADAGVRMAVATSKSESAATAIVHGIGLDGYFALVGGADHDIGRIGKGAVIGSVLDRLGLACDDHPPAAPRSDVVMVGDRHHDVDGATEHGLACLGVSWGYAAPGELHGADAVATDPTALADLLLTTS